MDGCACVSTTVSAPITRSGPSSGFSVCPGTIVTKLNNAHEMMEQVDAQRVSRRPLLPCVLLWLRDTHEYLRNRVGLDPLRTWRVLFREPSPIAHHVRIWRSVELNLYARRFPITPCDEGSQMQERRVSRVVYSVLEYEELWEEPPGFFSQTFPQLFQEMRVTVDEV